MSGQSTVHARWRSVPSLILKITLLVATKWTSGLVGAEPASSFEFAMPPPPPNIHAVIVSSSRYWFNYRHAMNALGIYKILQENGVPDDQIVLMLADEYATNARNPFKNGMYANGINPSDTWYSADTEIDYRGSDVTVQNFFNAVLGKGPRSLQETNEESRLLIFVTGHGGDQFFKFQDEEELTARDIANLMDELARRKKFQKALFIADTCQAFTLFDNIDPEIRHPNVYTLGTSLRDENAYAHHSDRRLGLSVIERWTHAFLQEYRKKKVHPPSTNLHQLMVEPFGGEAALLGAHVGTKGNFKDIRLSEFFGTSDNATPSSQDPKFVLKELTPSSVTIHPGPYKEQPTHSSTHQSLPEETCSASSISNVNSTTMEPDDASFVYMVVALMLIVLLSSSFGRSSNNEDPDMIT